MKRLVERMRWLNAPDWGWAGDVLQVTTSPETDCWQRTHYGFRRDNMHALLLPVTARFRLRGSFRFEPNAQYDQCGLYVRAGAECWFKCSVEYEPEGASHLGSVVTNGGYSDWATQEIASSTREMSYEVEVDHFDLVARFSTNGQRWHQMRVAHLDVAGQLSAGIYGCSPVGQGFHFEVRALEIEEPG